MREGESLSGVWVTVDSLRVNQLYTELKRLPQVAGVSIKVAMIESFRNTIAENLLRIRLFNVDLPRSSRSEWFTTQPAFRSLSVPANWRPCE